jgi:hypothetical protein
MYRSALCLLFDKLDDIIAVFLNGAYYSCIFNNLVTTIWPHASYPYQNSLKLDNVTASQHVPLYLYQIKRKETQHLLFTLDGQVCLPFACTPTFTPPYQHFFN